MSCEGLSFLGIEITNADNKNNETIISKGKTLVLVIPTNEELAIAQQVESVLRREEHPVEAEELTS
jgi:acetate kinase